MDQRTKDLLVKKIAHVIYSSELADFSKINLSTINENVKFFTSNDLTFALVGSPTTKFEEVIEGLLEYNNWGDKFSEKYVENAIRNLIDNVLKEGDKKSVQDRVATLFDQLIDDFNKYSTEHVVYIPLEGIDMREGEWPNDELFIGNIVLRKMTEARIEEFMNAFESIMSRSKNSPGTIKGMLKTARERLDKWRVYTEFRVVAEETRAYERSADLSRRVIDLIRYSTPFLCNEGLRIAQGVGLLGEVLTFSPETALIFPSNMEKFQIKGTAKGPLGKFELTTKNLEAMKEIGVSSIATLLNKEDLNSLGESLIRGVHWVANSLVQLEKENELLNLITCLESLIPLDNRNIKNTIAEGVAIIIAAPQGVKPRTMRNKGALDEFEGEKMKLEDFIKSMYTKRGTIAHGGHVKVLKWELEKLRRIALTLVICMTKQMDDQKFQDRNSLSIWIECNKLKLECEKLKYV